VNSAETAAKPPASPLLSADPKATLTFSAEKDGSLRVIYAGWDDGGSRPSGRGGGRRSLRVTVRCMSSAGGVAVHRPGAGSVPQLGRAGRGGAYQNDRSGRRRRTARGDGTDGGSMNRHQAIKTAARAAEAGRALPD
jgi:hypothetical protein